MWMFRSDLVPRKRLLWRKRSQKRDLWLGMPLKRKVFIKHMNDLEWFGYRCDCADEYNQTFYCFESYGSKNDCSRSILTFKRLLVWLYLEEGKVWFWMWLLRSDFASLMTVKWNVNSYIYTFWLYLKFFFLYHLSITIKIIN